MVYDICIAHISRNHFIDLDLHEYPVEMFSNSVPTMGEQFWWYKIWPCTFVVLDFADCFFNLMNSWDLIETGLFWSLW